MEIRNENKKPSNESSNTFLHLDTGLPAYIPLPQFLLQMDLSQTAKILYALLLNRARLSQSRKWIDDHERIFLIYPITNLAKDMNLGESAIKRALNDLADADLIWRKRTGYNQPNHLYVKLPSAFPTGRSPTVQNRPVTGSENDPSDSPKTNPQTVRKRTSNNINKSQENSHFIYKSTKDYSFEEGESL